MPLWRPWSRILGVLLLAGATLTAQAETVRIEVDDLTVRGRLERAEGSSLADGVILLVHDTAGHYGMPFIRQVQEGLTEQGYNTLAINLALGLDDRSETLPCNVVQNHRHEDAMAQIAAWVEWLAQRGTQGVALFGHARGGNQVAWYAVENRDPRVRAVAMAAPITWKMERSMERYRERFNRDLKVYLRHALSLHARQGADAEMTVPGFLRCGESRVTAAAFRSYYGMGPHKDTPTVLRELEVPGLVLAGERDDRMPDLAERVAPLAEEEANLEAILFPDSDHSFRGLHGEIADRLGAFLAQKDVF